MVVEHATLEDAVANGIDLSSNAFMLIHGWTCGPLLLEFVANFLQPLTRTPQTAARLAEDTGAAEGPVAITLRTCCVLGYLEFDPDTDVYSVVQGPELQELDTYLRPSAQTAKALQKMYKDDMSPPFKVPSKEATYCLTVWAEHQPTWRKSKSKFLPILLDGIVLAPLLTSITYFARWNEEGLDFGKEAAMDRIDFTKVDAVARVALGDIFDEIGVGNMSAKGIVTMSPKGSLALQRCYSYFVPTSYSPMLSEFHTILFEDPGWGFVDAGQDAMETEIHCERTLNVVGSGAQHKTLFKDLMRHIDVVFAGEDYRSQPASVVDTGSGSGHLLMEIYEHIKSHMPRGKVLSEHPLMMVGVDFNEEARVATAVNLSKRDIPHVVLFGDIGKPDEIMKALKKRNIDLGRCLHVRSFLDHDRPYIPPVNPIAPDSVTGRYAKAQMADFVHLDKAGKRITPLEVLASLVEHFQRWGDALDGSFGLCMLEVMMLDVPTTKRFFNDCVSFHFDIVQCLSRQYMISPPAFAMGSAMAGLVPVNMKNVMTYPEQGKYCRMMNQHLVRRPFRIRFAELSDLPRLEELEALLWGELMAAPDVLRRRLETSPMTCLVCEMDEKVVSVLYMQLVTSLDVVDQENFMQISDHHSPDGSVMQLIAICSDPEFGHLGIGDDLRAFALHLARVDPKVETVIGVTRCKGFNTYPGSMQEYVDEHVAGTKFDNTVGFHTSYGAEVVRLVLGFRPEDRDNQGIGVLIQYHVKEFGMRQDKPSDKKAKGIGVLPTLDLIETILEEVGFPLDRNELGKGFFDYGMDSLELVRIRNRLSTALSMELPATLLLDFPSVQDLSEQLDKDRGMGAKPVLEEEELPEEGAKTGWDVLGADDVLFFQDQIKEVYSTPHFQKKLNDCAKRCYPDMYKYCLMIETILVEAEGPVMRELGIIPDITWATVQDARGKMTSAFATYWWDVPEVRNKAQELLRLTKQDQIWD